MPGHLGSPGQDCNSRPACASWTCTCAPGRNAVRLSRGLSGDLALPLCIGARRLPPPGYSQVKVLSGPGDPRLPWAACPPSPRLPCPFRFLHWESAPLELPLELPTPRAPRRGSILLSPAPSASPGAGTPPPTPRSCPSYSPHPQLRRCSPRAAAFPDPGLGPQESGSSSALLPRALRPPSGFCSG